MPLLLKSIKALILVLDLGRKVDLGRDAVETLDPSLASESLSVLVPMTQS